MYEKRDGNLIGCCPSRYTRVPGAGCRVPEVFLSYLILGISITDHSSQGYLLSLGVIIPNE